MSPRFKNIITWTVKISLGLVSFLLIYWRLKNDLTPDKITFLKQCFTSFSAWGLLAGCLLLIPINWAIESYKWQQITLPVEPLSFGIATKSVYSGICAGNFAPGRATEFLAKILFFQPENRSTVTLLHFANGMFQLAITIIAGLISILIKIQMAFQVKTSFLVLLISFCLVLLSLFTFSILNFNKIQQRMMKYFKNKSESFNYTFTKPLILKLFFLSVLRYAVFILQFVLLLRIFYTGPLALNIIASISIYFLLTTVLPMISLIEAAIRAAIAIIVFSGLDIPEVSLIVTAILLWISNIVLPSIVGYIIIVKEKFEFSFIRR